MNSNNDEQSLRDAFDSWTKALNEGDLDTFWSLYHDDAEIMDEDFPWRMNKADFIDHLNFHVAGGGTGLWEFFQWIPREVNLVAIGDTGHISGYSTLRGKPRDAGFRQRFMGFTLTWVRVDGKWRLLCWHQSPLEARILAASPT